MTSHANVILKLSLKQMQTYDNVKLKDNKASLGNHLVFVCLRLIFKK